MGILRHSLMASLALVASVLQAQAPSDSPLGRGQAGVIQPEALQIVQLANQARAQAGAGPLQWDTALALAARQHCLRMAAEGPIAHRYGDEPNLSERGAQAGAHFSLIEENVAIGPDPSAIHDEWMRSAGHRTNLLNPKVNRVGVAVVASRGVLYAVADYERDVPVLTQTQVEATIAALLRASGVTVLRDTTLARSGCIVNQGMPASASGPQPQFIMRWQDAELSRLPQDLMEKLASGEFHQASVGSCPPQGEQGYFTAYRIAVLLY
jgi:uncharacterized protein YkwD